MGLNIVAYAEPFDAEKHAGRYGSLVIGCVDNHLARIELNKTRGIWLDAGNSRVSGQIVAIGRVLRPFPCSKPDVKLSLHPAFQLGSNTQQDAIGG